MSRTWRDTLGTLIAALSVGAIATSSGPVEGRPGQPDVVIVGDSLTGGNASYIAPRLRSAGLDAQVEGLSARRIAVSFEFLGYRDSGIERIRRLRAAGVDPDLWVIQLGTNDLGAVKNCRCVDRVAFAVELIDRLLAELPPNRPVAWVTLMNRADYDVTNIFNEALRRRAVINPYMRLIDWAKISLQRPDWFIDAVHPNNVGMIRFTQMYIDDIRTLLADPPGPTPPRPGVQPALRLGTPLK
ncbi:MAG TPA: GDSL-type esterase/lipase family protein [Ilumatobacteraceae bacterium]|nr:GDSL-type esterase/lipase family protein [Ilumatobacteraceae bacterium]